MAVKKRDDEIILFGNRSFKLNQPQKTPLQLLHENRASPGKAARNIQVARSTPKAPQQGFTSRVRDVFDANSAADRYRRTIAGQPADYATQQREVFGQERPFMNLGQQLLGTSARLANTARAGAGGVYGLAQIGRESAFGSDESYQRRLQEVQETLKRDLSSTGGLLGTGTPFSGYDEASNISASKLAKKTLGTGIGTAGEIIPIAKGAKAAKTAGKLATPLKRSGARFGMGAAEGVAAETGYQLSTQDKLNLQQIAAAGLTGGAFEAGSYALGQGVKKAGRSLRRTEAPTLKTRLSLDLANSGLVDPKIKMVKRDLLKIGSDAIGDGLDESRVIQVMDDIRAGREIEPLVVTRENGGVFIQDGAHRLAAASELGIEDIPVVEKIPRADKVFEAPEGSVARQVSDAVEPVERAVKETPQAVTAEADVPSVREVADEADSAIKVTDEELVDMGIDPRDPFRNDKMAQRLRNEFGRAFIDEDTEMLTLLRRLDKQLGTNFQQDWLFDTNTLRASNSIANARMRTSADLQEAFGGLGRRELTAFDEFAAARRELSFPEEFKTSRSPAELQQIVARGGDEFNSRFSALNKYYKNLALDMRKAGLIDDKKLGQYLSNNDYVRIQRDVEDLVGVGRGSGRSKSLGSTTATQKLRGSQREILSPSQTTLNRTQQIQLEIQRNKAATRTIDNLESAGLAKRVSNARGKNTVKRLKNGGVEYWEVPGDIKRIMDSVNPYHLGTLQKILSAPSRVFRAGTTALSAPFTVTNYLRDQASSGIYSKQVLATHHPANIISGLGAATRDFTSDQGSELWEKFARFAGDQTIYDELRNVKSSKQLLREVRRGKTGKYTNMLLSPVRSLEDLNSITEKATRYQNFKGIYKSTLKKTGNEDQAIQEAVQAAFQNSVNFQRAGIASRYINMAIPYFNAGIQGSRNVGRSFRDRPLATSAKSISMIALPMMYFTAQNMDSPEKREIYESIDDWEKENNFIIISPWAQQTESGRWEGIIKIPKPQGYREIVEPTRLVTEAYLKEEPIEVSARMAQDMAQGLLGPINIEDKNKFISSLIPQAVKPLVQQELNEDLYTGGQIVPDFMLEGTDDATKRAYEGTSGTARWIAEQLGIEPLRVEKFVTDTFGSLGRYGLNAADNAAATQNEDFTIGGRSMADDFSRRLFEASGDKLESSKTSGEKYYDNVKQATSGLSEQEQRAWDVIHPSKTNFLGEDIFNEDKGASRYEKAGIYLQYPNLIERERQLNRLGVEDGNLSNPLWDLSNEQLKQVLLKRTLPPGASDPTLSNLWQEDWYEEYQAKNDIFYSQIQKRLESEGKSLPQQENPYPTASDELQGYFDAYYQLDRGTGARSAWIRANPNAWAQMQAQFDRKRDWQNRERQKLGLGPLEEFESGSGSYSSSRGGYGGRSGGSSSGSAHLKVRAPKTLGQMKTSVKKLSQPKLKVPTVQTAAPKFKKQEKVKIKYSKA